MKTARFLRGPHPQLNRTTYTRYARTYPCWKPTIGSLMRQSVRTSAVILKPSITHARITLSEGLRRFTPQTRLQYERKINGNTEFHLQRTAKRRVRWTLHLLPDQFITLNLVVRQRLKPWNFIYLATNTYPKNRVLTSSTTWKMFLISTTSPTTGSAYPSILTNLSRYSKDTSVIRCRSDQE